MIETFQNANTIQKALMVVPFFVLVLSAIANIIMAAHVSDSGSRLHVYEEKIARTRAHNDDMLQELAGKQSLMSLREWALSQGFVPHGELTVVRPSAPKIARVDMQ